MNAMILAINPGSTSTKFSVFVDEIEKFQKTIRHSNEDLQEFNTIIAQEDFRYGLIMQELKQAEIELNSLTAVVGRGGLLHPLEGGTYLVEEPMLRDIREAKYGEHASNLGAVLADRIAKDLNIPAYIVDPVVVDEMEKIARFSGSPRFERISIMHALNHKAVARLAADQLQKAYQDLNLIVAHLGGGISVGLHRKGRVVDVNNALDGEGPFSPERSGSLYSGLLIDLCYSGKFTHREVRSLIKGRGGLIAYLGTNDAREVVKRIKAGDDYAKLIYEAMAYQIAKEIGSLAPIVNGEIDAIVLTGGLAYDSEILVPLIQEKVSFIAPVMIFPGEEEMQALAAGAYRVIHGEEVVNHYLPA